MVRDRSRNAIQAAGLPPWHDSQPAFVGAWAQEPLRKSAVAVISIISTTYIEQDRAGFVLRPRCSILEH